MFFACGDKESNDIQEVVELVPPETYILFNDASYTTVTNNSGIQSSSGTSSISIGNPESELVNVNNAILTKHTSVQTNFDSTFDDFIGRIRVIPHKRRFRRRIRMHSRPYYMFPQNFNQIMLAPETRMMLSNGPNDNAVTEGETFPHRAVTGVENCNSPDGIVRYSQYHLFKAVFKDNVEPSAKKNCTNSIKFLNRRLKCDLWKSVKFVLKNIIEKVDQMVSETDMMFESEPENAVTIKHVSTNTEITINNHNNTIYLNNKHRFNRTVINNCTNTNEKRTKIVDNAEVINDDCDVTNDAVLTVDNTSNDIITVVDSVSTSNNTVSPIFNNASKHSVSEMTLKSVNATEVSVNNYNIRKSSSLSVDASTSTSRSKQEKMTPTISRDRLSRRKRRQKTQQNISKLFNHLRDVSQNASRTSLSNTVISLDDTQNTVIDLIDNRNESTSNVAESSMIIIPDDDIQTNACSTPKQKISLHHSTPKSQTKLDELIITRSNNNCSLQNLNKNVNVTKEINSDSYLTIDLTAESALNKTEPTVIDLENTTDHDVTIVATSTSNISSMSGDSDVTVLRQPMKRKLKKFTNGIASLNASEKGKLLELITQTIFNGCNVPANAQSGMNIRKSLLRVPDTAENTYIKDVIIGGKASRCSVGSNVYHPDRQSGIKTGLRMVVIDGSNVAMKHGRGQHFSVRGLQICIDYFLSRGHVVKAFVPCFRRRHGMSTDGRLLDFLERKGLVIYTPSRRLYGRNITPYDDRYIIQCAAEFDAVIVSGDNYRDLIHENPRWRNVIENRLLPFTWVNDMIMFPRDPLGRYGPTLETFLKY